jgi:RHS repeat-associated protein
VSYAGSRYDSSLDRSYEYDQVGRLVVSHSGAEARAAAWTGQWGTMDGPYSQGYVYDQWGNMTQRYGWGGEVHGTTAGNTNYLNYYYQTSSGGPNYGQINNQRSGFGYDAAGNLTWDGGQSFQYDVTGQQTSASYGGYYLNQYYDGDGLRVAKDDNGAVTYYLRSTLLGGQVVSEFNSGGGWMRGYVYQSNGLLAILQNGTIYWNHEDPVTKSKRITDSSGNVYSAVESDPFGADTNRSGNQYFQPHRYTNYERDGNQSDVAMFRRFNRWHSRFDQPDSFDGSYDAGNPQSFNRYAYVQNDPVNLVDPTGLEATVCGIDQNWEQCVGAGWFGPFAGPGFSGGNGWGGDPHPGWGDIVDDEARLHPLVYQIGERQFNANFHSVFEGWAWWWDEYDLFQTPQNPQPLPPNYKPMADAQEPCMNRTGQVLRDLESIASMVGGTVRGYQTGGRYPGVNITPRRGQTFSGAIDRLTNKGFVSATVLGIGSLDHPEGESLEKQFADGLWYHVVVNYPKDRDNPKARTPRITAHCHATDPVGFSHIYDRLMFGP